MGLRKLMALNDILHSTRIYVLPSNGEINLECIKVAQTKTPFPSQSRGRNCSLFLVLGDGSLCSKQGTGQPSLGLRSERGAAETVSMAPLGSKQPVFVGQEELQPRS